MSTARKLKSLPDHPDLFVMPDSMAPMVLPSMPITAPIKWDEDTKLRTSKGTEKKRFGSFSAARRMLDCEPQKLRVILRTGLIYAYKGTDHEKSWWVIDLAGIYLYRENQRRKCIGLPATAAWAAYTAHMKALNGVDPAVEGPPVVG